MAGIFIRRETAIASRFALIKGIKIQPGNPPTHQINGVRPGSFLVKMFGDGKGSGAAFLFLVIAFAGIGVCLYFRRDQYIWKLEE